VTLLRPIEARIECSDLETSQRLIILTAPLSEKTNSPTASGSGEVGYIDKVILGFF
jgi:hypothetical protein